MTMNILECGTLDFALSIFIGLYTLVVGFFAMSKGGILIRYIDLQFCELYQEMFQHKQVKLRTFVSAFGICNCMKSAD